MDLITHPGCGKQWSGLRRGHCPACHETFNSGTAGDRHRVGTPGTDRRCLPPVDAGLVPVEHTWGICWQAPGAFPQSR